MSRAHQLKTEVSTFKERLRTSPHCMIHHRFRPLWSQITPSTGSETRNRSHTFSNTPVDSSAHCEFNALMACIPPPSLLAVCIGWKEGRKEGMIAREVVKCRQ
ncbi:hypothetical protein Mapa_014761 [Marchantia paleacea]|nr:hypothetical protein Mapa_014761 [Marchantia paleacea]